MKGVALVAGAGLLAALAAFGATTGNTYYLSVGYSIFLYIALASSWNVMSGFTGYTSFGHVAFYGVGAYMAAILMFDYFWTWIAAFLAGGVAAALLAVAIGWPCLRLKGPYFAISMLGIAEVLRIVGLTWESVTYGGTGIPLLSALPLRGFYFLMGGVALVAVGLALLVSRSRFGLRLLALREDEVGAEMMGINTTAYKLAAFVLSAVIPGIAGGIDASRVGFIEPISTFNVFITIQMIIMTMFGGRATVLGPVIGAVVLSLVREGLWARYPYDYQALFGVLIIGLILFMPEGVMGVVRTRRRAAKVAAP